MTPAAWPTISFSDFLKPNRRPYTLGPTEDANLLGMRWYGLGPFHRELKAATKIRKKSHFVVRASDVIYNKLFAWKGTFGIVPPELDGMFVSDKFPTYELDETIIDPSFLRWYFRYPPLWEQARQLSTGSAALSKLTLNPPRFLELTIPRPSLDEQRRIVARIEYFASHIREANECRLRSSEERRALRGAFLHTLSKRLPNLGRLSRVLRTKPRNGWSAKCDNGNGGVPVLTLSAVTGYAYDPLAFKRTSIPTDPHAHYWLQPGDLLITRSNTPQLVGHAAIYDGEPHPCIYPDLMMRLDLDGSVADRTFVWCWLQSPVVREFIERYAKGTSPTMKKISQSVVMNIPFPDTITVEEQRQMVNQFTAIQGKLEEMSRLQKQTAVEVEALLPSILDRAFKGAL